MNKSRKIIFAKLFFLLLLGQLSLFPKSASAYQLELDYFDDITKDTVTKNGIFRQVIVYVKAAPTVLNKIRSVTYHLDENFYKPNLTVTCRTNNFQLEVNTLNHIPVSADVYFTDGKLTKLDKYILLGTRKNPRESAYNIHLRHVVTKTPDPRKGETDYEVDLLVEGPEKDLEQLSYIEYYFSRPYPHRKIKVSSKTPNFKYHIVSESQLDVQGYAYFKDGSVIELVRFIYFKYY